MDNCIMLLFNSKCKRQWINVIYLYVEHNIYAMSYNIKCMCIPWKTGEGLCEPRLYHSF